MPGKTAKVTITERQQDILRTIQNAPTVSSQLRQRAAIILLAFDRQDNPQIAAQVGLSRRQVSSADDVGRAGPAHSHRVPRKPCRAFTGPSTSPPRCAPPGPPGKFTPAQIVQILAWPRAPGEVRSTHHSLDGPRTGR